MADNRKEIFDYLRNKQKAAEIEAKVNGINLWVLLGAIAIIAWNLIGTLNTEAWTHHEVISRTLLCETAVFLMIIITSQSNEKREEIRYQVSNPADIESPFLLLLLGVFLSLPTAIHFFAIKPGSNDTFFQFIEPFIGAFAIGLFGIVSIPASLICLISRVFSKETKYEGLLNPVFVSSRRESTIAILIFLALMFVALVDQTNSLLHQIPSLSVESIRTVALTTTLHLLILTAIIRGIDNKKINWTYEMETDLVLGTISPETALRRIENTALGPRLQDVMNTFFDALDKKFVAIEASLTECKIQLEDVKIIPREAEVNRAKQIQDAIKEPLNNIETTTKDCDDLEKYLKKLSAIRSHTNRPGIATILPSLVSRQAAYAERARAAKEQLDQLVMQASE
jgi:hypothetical protein